MTRPVRMLFFGSGSVALPALERLLASPLVELDSVVTAPPRPAGRKGTLTPTVVADAATEAHLPLRTPATLRDPAVQDELRSIGAELIVLADYGRIVPGAILDLPRHGALNIHPSLLPRHRGATPVSAAIIAGDATTGVTLMRMDQGLDTGPIVAQHEVALDGTETAPELEARLARWGADLLMEHLPAWLDGTRIARPQVEQGATLTRPLRRDDGRLDPSRPAQDLERQVRAYQPWPGSFLELPDGRLKVWRASVVREDGGPRAGELVIGDDTLLLGTPRDTLSLDEVQAAGKRRMPTPEYLRGRRR